MGQEQSSPATAFDVNDPDRLWRDKLSHEHVVEPWTPVDPNTPKPADHVRVVCVSDTHNTLVESLPPGDLLLHAGDFSNTGTVKNVEAVSQWFARIRSQYQEIVVIAGNHDLTFSPDYAEIGSHFHRRGLEDAAAAKAALQHCIYIEDQEIELLGLRIYGAPWQPRFFDWGFNADRGADIAQHWAKIPDNVDILMTHGPPLGYGDLTVTNQHVGCADLLREVVTRVKPRFHVFGHIHEGFGGWSNGETVFINASTCNIRYKPLNAPVCFDILPRRVSEREKKNNNDDF